MTAGVYSCNVFRRYKQSCELVHTFVGQTYPEKSTTEFIITPSPTNVNQYCNQSHRKLKIKNVNI